MPEVVTKFPSAQGEYVFVPTRGYVWGAYHVPEIVRWFKTRKAAENFSTANFRGSRYFVVRAYYPPRK